MTDFAVGEQRFNALEVGHEFAFGDGGNVRTDTTGFLRFTGAPNDAALHWAFASQFTNTCHKSIFPKIRNGKHTDLKAACKLFSRLFQTDFFAFAVKGGLVNPKDLGGFGETRSAFKDLSQVDFLEFFE